MIAFDSRCLERSKNHERGLKTSLQRQRQRSTMRLWTLKASVAFVFVLVFLEDSGHCTHAGFSVPFASAFAFSTKRRSVSAGWSERTSDSDKSSRMATMAPFPSQRHHQATVLYSAFAATPSNVTMEPTSGRRSPIPNEVRPARSVESASFHCQSCITLTSTRTPNGTSTELSPLDTTSTTKTTQSSSSASPEQRSRFYRPGSMMAATVERGSVPYGEESRQFRRTVFTAPDWIEHRNPRRGRIMSNLQGLFYSGILRQLSMELWLVCAVSVAVVVLNNSGVAEISLPAVPFQLSSPALGLLLVFRTNASYARWTEARSTWSRMEANANNIVRMAATFIDLTDPTTTMKRRRALYELSRATWAYTRSLMNQLLTQEEDEDAYVEQMRSAFHDHHSKRDAVLCERILAAPDRTLAAWTEASLALDRLRDGIDEKRRVEIDKSLVILGDCSSTCSKIYNSPVPLVYTRHTARFLSVWLVLLPAALYEPFAHEEFAGSVLCSGFAVIPATAVIAIFLLGIEELAVSLEEPFSILPLQTYCNDMQQSMHRVLDWCFASADQEAQPSVDE
jgi:ion channel-forming bestrophin family protein